MRERGLVRGGRLSAVSIEHLAARITKLTVTGCRPGTEESDSGWRSLLLNVTAREV